MAIQNLEVGRKVINHKNQIATIVAIEGKIVKVQFEQGIIKEYAKVAMARWWKDLEVTEEPQEEPQEEPTVEEVVQEIFDMTPVEEEKEEPISVVESSPMEMEVSAPLETKEEDKEKREEDKKERSKHKEELESMRDTIVGEILSRFDGTTLKVNPKYKAIKHPKGKILMEVHAKGEYCRIYMVDPLPDFEESTMFNRHDGSHAWTIRHGYEVPVQMTHDVIEEVVRLFGCAMESYNYQLQKKEEEKARKKAEKKAQKESAKKAQQA